MIMRSIISALIVFKHSAERLPLILIQNETSDCPFGFRLFFIRHHVYGISNACHTLDPWQHVCG